MLRQGKLVSYKDESALTLHEIFLRGMKASGEKKAVVVNICHPSVVELIERTAEKIDVGSIPGRVKPKTTNWCSLFLCLTFSNYKRKCGASTVCGREVGR